ncbi:MAG: hypothetical protein ACHQUB_03130 [Candidatus Saccharimonadia bacterium]
MITKVTKIAAVSMVASTISLVFVVSANAATSSLSTTSSNTTVSSNSTTVSSSGNSNQATPLVGNTQTAGGNQAAPVGSGTNQTGSNSGTSLTNQNTTSGSNPNNLIGKSAQGNSTSSASTLAGTNSSAGTSTLGSSMTPTDQSVNSAAQTTDTTGLNSMIPASSSATAATDVSASSALPVTPKVQAQLVAQWSQPTQYPVTISRQGSDVVPVAPTPSVPAKTPPQPPKNLPIQGALQGISAILATTTLPRPLQHSVGLAVLAAPVLATSLISLFGLLIALIDIASARFVDRLRASGFAHAARGDASAALTFATPQNVSFVWATLLPNQQLAFFGVRNKWRTGWTGAFQRLDQGSGYFAELLQNFNFRSVLELHPVELVRATKYL